MLNVEKVPACDHALFEPYAKVLADRAALLQPERILETAAGTGILTRALHGTVPQAEVVATDVNPVMFGGGGAAAQLRPRVFQAGGRTGSDIRR